MAAMDINPDAKALEEAFFAEENARLLVQLRKKTALEERRAALREVVLIQDEDYLHHLMELGIRPSTVLALSLVPLMAVAWADGKLDDRERDAVLKAAETRGVAPDSPGHTGRPGHASPAARSSGIDGGCSGLGGTRGPFCRGVGQRPADSAAGGGS